MTDNQSLFSMYGKSPLYQLFVSLFLILFVGLFLFSASLLAGLLLMDGEFNKITGIMSSEISDKDIGLLRYILVSQEICFFLVPGIIILKLMKPVSHQGTFNFKIPASTDILLVVILGFCLFPITSFTGELNSWMHLPQWLSGVEKWMADKESDSDHVINILMTPDTFVPMLFNILLIGILPALGEELIFRGVFQKIFTGLFKSGHIAIWTTAFLFSALHFQFFGFLPRFILGLVFGYLFFWSGKLWLPILSHFFNNAVSVVLIYLQAGEHSLVIPEISSRQQMISLPLPIVVSLLILVYFHNRNKRESAGIDKSEY